MNQFVNKEMHSALKLRPGKVFVDKPLAEVTEFLQERRIERIAVAPSSLKLLPESDGLILERTNGKVSRHFVRHAFINKLYNWYKLPDALVNNMSLEGAVAFGNEILRTIRSNVVLVLENGEALTVVSPKYTFTDDLMVLSACKELDITRIYRDDFMTRAYFRQNRKIEPRVNDAIECGIHLINSETGFRAFELSAFLLRLVCTNGAVHRIRLGDGQNKFYHHGLNPYTVRWYMAEFMKLLGPYFAELELKMKRLTSTPFHPDDPFITENIRSGMPAFAWNNLMKEYKKEYGQESTLYDLYNHITSHAKSLDMPGLRLMYETIAGKIAEI